MKKNVFAWWLFWISVWLNLYSYFIFPLLVILRGILRPQPIRCVASPLPSVSIVIAAYNEASVITRKLDNTFALDYPEDRLEVIVASDGSDDETNKLVAAYNNPRIKLLKLSRQGKNSTLNAGVAASNGDVLVFTDADSMFAPDALHHLVVPFSDPLVGGVAGDYRHDTGVAQGANERSYWRYERKLKELQSSAGSMTSAWGPIYAVRRSLFVPIPTGVTDDYYISVQVLAAHQRLVYQPKAKAVGPVADSAKSEFKRKVRIITAGLKGTWLMRRLFNPFEYGFIAVQVFSHKFLRRLMVIPLVLMAVTAPMLWGYGLFYKLATVGQLGLHLLAALGFLLRDKPVGQQKLLRLPFFFDMVYTAAGVALINLVKGTRHDIWNTQQTSQTKPQ